MPYISWLRSDSSPVISDLTRLCARTLCHLGIELTQCLHVSGAATHSGRSHTSFIVMQSNTGSPRSFFMCRNPEKKFCPPRTVDMQMSEAASICSSGHTTS